MPEIQFNPFSEIGKHDERVYSEILNQRKDIRTAERKYSKLVEKFGDLLQDQRYQEILKLSEAVLKDQLNLLIQTACQCRSCGPIAERVRLIKEMVRMPLETVWYESRRSEMEATIGESSNGA